ncbi:hypothetical protein W97_08774 [Coniosporium apollinis CBS 100218]|uniref:Uncharacterized protein n=1 Tax=Coniosporium apollinis (strain CBS 100218) TaxID=1168221 RepID=R7Z663_CONA1|nr:uncharacterized protein W97_08774 [Coniosporium apollinis CBS 100218]EON69514.1 hypothetical protein W97_08774 [Coniosporium apollinis CBS 100218]
MASHAVAEATAVPTTLIVVCCHAFYVPNGPNPILPHESDPNLANPYLESNWHLKPFQRSPFAKPGEHETFIQHILAGLQAILHGQSADDCVLVFSGGQTERSIRPLSEAASYWNAARGVLRQTSGEHQISLLLSLRGKSRILLEEHATDSYQNLLFSIIAFRKAWGCYPKSVRVVTHAFKAKRFMALHARAIRWPEHRFQVQGIDPIMSYSELELTKRGEEINAYGQFLNDLYGTKLAHSLKRKERGWDECEEAFKRWVAEFGKPTEQGLDDSAVKELLQWQGGRGGRELFSKRMPWEDDA